MGQQDLTTGFFLKTQTLAKCVSATLINWVKYTHSDTEVTCQAASIDCQIVNKKVSSDQASQNVQMILCGVITTQEVWSCSNNDVGASLG